MFEQNRGVKRVREQDSEPMIDRHGNSATPKLFVNRLPHNITEPEVSSLFNKYDGFASTQLGNKVLMPGEFRTCVVTYSTPEQAAAARVGLQHHQGGGWTNPMLINFVKQDARDPPAHTASIPDDSEKDSLGNFACATLFVKNFAPSFNQEGLAALFPAASKIVPGNKQLRPGEFRTAYLTFEDTASAISARRSKLGYTDEQQTAPLVIYYSVRPQDQNKPRGYGMPKVAPTPSYPLPSLYPVMPPSSIPPPYPPYPSNIPMNPYSVPSIYGGYPPPSPPNYADSYNHSAPYHPRSSPADDGRYSLSDLFDAKGNAASNSLFVDCLPYNVREDQIRAIFSRCAGFKGLHMGNKILAANEYRTAVIHFLSTEDALRARAQIQHYREPGWTRPLIIHYAKH